MSIGTAALIQGASRGLDDIAARQAQQDDRAYELRRREREDTQYQQGQEDREYTLRRRAVTDRRSDEEYGLRREQQEFTRKFDEAMRRYAMSDGADYQGLVDVYNAHFPDGGKVMMRRDPDGTYAMSFEGRDGRKSAKSGLTFDQVGELAMGMRDPNTWIAHRQATSAKASERQADLSQAITLARVKGEEDRKTERLKAGYKGDEGKIPAYAKELSDLAKEYYGGTYENGMWSFERGKEIKAATHADLAERIYATMPAGKRSTNAAHLHAARVMKTIEEQASTKAKSQADDREGMFSSEIDGLSRSEWVERRTAQLTAQYADYYLGQLESRTGGTPTPSSTDQPPVAGARKAKDGQWYLRDQGTGKWMRVETEAPAMGASSGAGGPAAGTVVDGYRFRGGNPNDQANWDPVGAGDATAPQAEPQTLRREIPARRSQAPAPGQDQAYSEAQVAEMVRLMREQQQDRSVTTKKHLAAALAGKEAAEIVEKAYRRGVDHQLDRGILELALASGKLKKHVAGVVRSVLTEQGVALP